MSDKWKGAWIHQNDDQQGVPVQVHHLANPGNPRTGNEAVMQAKQMGRWCALCGENDPDPLHFAKVHQGSKAQTPRITTIQQEMAAEIAKMSQSDVDTLNNQFSPRHIANTDGSIEAQQRQAAINPDAKAIGDRLKWNPEQVTERVKPRNVDNWPLPSFDARDWAQAFCATVKLVQGVDLDEEWMITWFANALMRGYDECVSRDPEYRRRLRVALHPWWNWKRYFGK